MMLKVVFIGGLTNGKIVYDYLLKNKHVSLPLAITYPDDHSGARFIPFPNSPSIIKDMSANKWLDTIRQIGPDLIFVAGWSELLDEKLWSLPSLGTIGFHPSKLPYDRGRSVLAWQIEDGYTDTALSMFYYNNLPDGGDIIAQEKINIHPTDYINDVLNKIDRATYNLMYAYFPLIRRGQAPRLRQDPNVGSFRRLRKECDSQIDWNAPASEIINKIRAISHPYPGAEAIIQGTRYKIWRAEIINSDEASIQANDLIVQCRDNYLRINEYEPMQ